jgi:hypothetical protein
MLSDDLMAALAAAPAMPFANAPPAPAVRSGVASSPTEDVPVDPPAPVVRAEPPEPDPAAPIEDNGPPPRTLGEAFLAGMEWAHGTRNDASGA